MALTDWVHYEPQIDTAHLKKLTEAMQEQADRERRETARRHRYYLALDGMFMLALMGLALTGRTLPIPEGWTPVLFILAVFRVARTISFNNVAQPIRAPFTYTKPDSCRAGENVHPKGSGLRYVLGDLMSCPICTGTWAAIALVGLYLVAPGLGRVAVYALGFAGGSEVVHWTMEYFSWGGRLNRVQAGRISPDEEGE